MEDTKSVEKASKEKTSPPKRKTTLKKLDPESIKILQQIKERANKKNYGRKVRDGEIIAVALNLVSAEHIQKLQEATYSEKDRLHLAHEEYVKTHGKISLDQFIGLLIRGEISSQKRNLLESKG